MPPRVRPYWTSIHEFGRRPEYNPWDEVTLANGANQNVAIPWGSVAVRIVGPTGAFSIGGLTGGVDGQEIPLYNTMSQTMTINNQDAGSLEANRIKTLTGANVALRTTGESIARVRYDGAQSRWILISIY